MKIKSQSVVELKSGSVITCSRSNWNTISITAKPFKRKNNQPKSGRLHLTEDAALVLLTQLILALDIKSNDVLWEIEDRFVSIIKPEVE